MIYPGFITDELTQDYKFALKVAQAMGVKHIEVRTFGDSIPKAISSKDLQKAAHHNSIYGINVEVFCSPFGKSPIPNSSSEIDALAHFLRNELKRKQDIGARYIRLFPFERGIDPDPQKAAEMFARIITQVDIPKSVILIENGTVTNSPSLIHALRFLDHLEHVLPMAKTLDIGLLWDPGNSIFSGFFDPIGQPHFEVALKRVRHVHVKDYVDGQYVTFGEGIIDWEVILSDLRSVRFSGVMSLETHARDGRVLTKERRDQPWANDFTDGGFRPTLKSLFKLQELLRS